MKETIEIIDLKKHQFKMLIYMSIFLFLAFAGFTIYWEISYHNTMSQYIKTTAEVIDHSEKSGEIRDVIRFTANRGTDKEATHERVLSYASNHEIGSEIIVYYEASNPAVGQLMTTDTISNHNTLKYLLPIMTIIFAGCEIGLLYLYYNINISKYSATQKVKNSSNEADIMNETEPKDDNVNISETSSKGEEVDKICQSCGMPIKSSSDLGTESNGDINPDYCKYCYKDGEFIDKVTMPEYIDMCAQYGAQAGMTNEEMRAHCEKLFPTLKRWKRNRKSRK